MKINIDHWKQLLFAPNLKKKKALFFEIRQYICYFKM